MNQGNRVYQNSQVEFSRCSCLNKILKNNEHSDMKTPRVRNYKASSLEHSNRKYKQKHKHVGLKLSKNLVHADDDARIFEYDSKKNNNKISQFNVQNSQGVLKQAAVEQRKEERRISQTVNHHYNYLESNKNVSFAESHLLQASYQFNNKAVIAEEKHNFQQLIIIKNNSVLKQTALFAVENTNSPFNSVNNYNCGKINSTSSTTLFDTKKNIQEFQKQSGHQVKKNDKNTLQVPNKQTKNTKRVERVVNSLNIIDFSRVREVQTVMSSDSFSISLLDLGSERIDEGFQDIDIQLQNKQIEIEMKKILFN